VSMLEDAEAFYSSESQRLLTDTSSISDYLKTTEQRFSDEDDRATEYLHGSSRQKLREVVQRNLLINNADRIVEDKKSGGMVMLEQDAREDLSRLYRLFSREPETLDKLRKTLKTVVRAHGMQAVQSKDALSKPKQFVTTVVALRTKFQSVVKECFHGDRGCSKTLKEALEYFINMDTRAAKYLSLYVDDLMRNRVQNSTEQQIQVELDNVISMFRYLSEKDIFEDYYKQHLAHRLLTDKTTASDVEKQMIAKLKAECGHQFTSRLEGMFRDIDLSRTLTKGYQTSRAVEKGEVDFNMLILTTGYWPIPYVEDCALPRVAKACCANFEEYYNNLYSGKRIRWQTNLGTAEMLCVFNGQPKELLVHTYQMCILMLFERKEVFTYAEIKAETKIPEQELQRHLLSLAHPKVRVLRKQPNNKELAPEHQFAWNHEYKSNRHRVKIPLLSSKATQMNEDKKDQIANSVLEARKNGVEAAVVRILKTRSTIEHNELVAEVIKLLSHKFLLEPQFIKFRIESLIDREFMRRDEARRSKYHYIS
jgi:cullin 3